MTSIRFISSFVVLLALVRASSAGDTTALTNVAYKSGADLTEYETERCRLDLYLPTNRPFATLVWFHGGGLTGGNKESVKTLARMFTGEGVAVAAANYRLAPKVTFPAYVEDAAAAVAWTLAHIGAHGGDSNRVFVGGHSAGGYLTSMIGMNPDYLRKSGVERDNLAGLIPVSGQMVTHFNVRKERGLATNNVTADDAAPIFFLSADVPPMLVIMGDRDWPGRLEENAYFVAMQKVTGNRRVALLEVADRDHGSICSRIVQPHDPAREAILKFIRDPASIAADRTRAARDP